MRNVRRLCCVGLKARLAKLQSLGRIGYGRVVFENLAVRSSSVEVVGRLGVIHLRHKVGFGSPDIRPVDVGQERVALDLFGSFGAQTLCRVKAEEPIDEVSGLRRHVVLVLVPVDASGQDIVENLLRRRGVKRRDGCDKLMADDAQRPLQNIEVSDTRLPKAISSVLTQSTPSPTPTPRILSGATYCRGGLISNKQAGTLQPKTAYVNCADETMCFRILAWRGRWRL